MADVPVTLDEGADAQHYVLYKGKSTAAEGQFSGPDGGPGGDHTADFLVPAEWEYCTIQIQLPANSAATVTVDTYLTADDDDDGGSDEGTPDVAGTSSAVTKTYSIERARRIKIAWSGNTGTKNVIAYFVCHRR